MNAISRPRVGFGSSALVASLSTAATQVQHIAEEEQPCSTSTNESLNPDDYPANDQSDAGISSPVSEAEVVVTTDTDLATDRSVDSPESTYIPAVVTPPRANSTLRKTTPGIGNRKDSQITGALPVRVSGLKGRTRETINRRIRTPLNSPLSLVFFGAKGGAGKTTCAISVANAFNSLGLSTLVFDINPVGNAYVRIGQEKVLKHTLHDFYTAVSNHEITTRFDIEKFTFMTDTGVRVLGVPLNDQVDLKPEELTTIHDFCRKFYSFIIFDAGNDSNKEPMLTAAKIADVICVVTTMKTDDTDLFEGNIEFFSRLEKKMMLIVIKITEKRSLSLQEFIGTLLTNYCEPLNCPVRTLINMPELHGRHPALMWANLSWKGQLDLLELAATAIELHANTLKDMAPPDFKTSKSGSANARKSKTSHRKLGILRAYIVAKLVHHRTSTRPRSISQ